MYFKGITMPVNVSVKGVPEAIVEKLRQRAKRHHRSLQGELMVILEEAAGTPLLSIDEAEIRLKTLQFKTGDEATLWVREQRDGR
jgi:antitoxin FitA